MTSINNVSLQLFSSLFNSSSSNNISDGYRKNFLLARISREDKRESTQNYVENASEAAQKEQNVSNISDEVTISQSAKSEASKSSVNTSGFTTNANENSQTYDNTINQLKARKNSLQQTLNRLRQPENYQVNLSQKGDSETTQEVDANNPPLSKMMMEDAPLAKVLKRQIDKLEQEIMKSRNEPASGENINSTNGLSLSQLRQRKTMLEQQLRNMENETSRSTNIIQDINHNTTGEEVEEEGGFSYQKYLETLKIKQEIRNLESEINAQERKRIIDKTQTALNEIRNISNEAASAEDHLLDVEV